MISKWYVINLVNGSFDPCDTEGEAFDLAGHIATQPDHEWSKIKVICGELLDLEPTAKPREGE